MDESTCARPDCNEGIHPGRRKYCSAQCAKRARYRKAVYLKSGDRVPDFPPRRYPDNRGYIRLRWTVGPLSEVEVWEHRVRDGVVTDAEHVHHDNHDPSDNHPDNLVHLSEAEHQAIHGAEWRGDWARVVELYESGHTTPQVSRITGVEVGNVSRILAKSGVTARSREYYYPIPSRNDVEKAYREFSSAPEIADSLGYRVNTIRRALRVYGISSYPPGRRPRKDGPVVRQVGDVQ